MNLKLVGGILGVLVLGAGGMMGYSIMKAKERGVNFVNLIEKIKTENKNDRFIVENKIQHNLFDSVGEITIKPKETSLFDVYLVGKYNVEHGIMSWMDKDTKWSGEWYLKGKDVEEVKKKLGFGNGYFMTSVGVLTDNGVLISNNATEDFKISVTKNPNIKNPNIKRIGVESLNFNKSTSKINFDANKNQINVDFETPEVNGKNEETGENFKVFKGKGSIVSNKKDNLLDIKTLIPEILMKDKNSNISIKNISYEQKMNTANSMLSHGEFSMSDLVIDVVPLQGKLMMGKFAVSSDGVLEKNSTSYKVSTKIELENISGERLGKKEFAGSFGTKISLSGMEKESTDKILKLTEKFLQNPNEFNDEKNEIPKLINKFLAHGVDLSIDKFDIKSDMLNMDLVARFLLQKSPNGNFSIIDNTKCLPSKIVMGEECINPSKINFRIKLASSGDVIKMLPMFIPANISSIIAPLGIIDVENKTANVDFIYNGLAAYVNGQEIPELSTDLYKWSEKLNLQLVYGGILAPPQQNPQVVVE